MIKVYVKKLSNYPVSVVRIKKFLKKYLSEKCISDCDVSVAIVGRETMLKLARKYLGEKNMLHNVLSFTESEVDKTFISPIDRLYLGEIVICYSKVFEESKSENKRIEDKVLELVAHGAEHLLGNHHK